PPPPPPAAQPQPAPPPPPPPPPSPPPPLPPLVQGQTGNIVLTKGSACYTPPAGHVCIPIVGEIQIPLGSTVDATNGEVQLTTTDGTFLFSLGAFVPTQV